MRRRNLDLWYMKSTTPLHGRLTPRRSDTGPRRGAHLPVFLCCGSGTGYTGQWKEWPPPCVRWLQSPGGPSGVSSRAAGNVRSGALSAASGALGEKFLDGASLAGAEFLIALRDHCPDFRVTPLALVLQLVGRELWNDRDHAASGFHFELLPALETRAAQGGRWHDHGRFVFEGNDHDSYTAWQSIRFQCTRGEPSRQTAEAQFVQLLFVRKRRQFAAVARPARFKTPSKSYRPAFRACRGVTMWNVSRWPFFRAALPACGRRSPRTSGYLHGTILFRRRFQPLRREAHLPSGGSARGFVKWELIRWNSHDDSVAGYVRWPVSDPAR